MQRGERHLEGTRFFGVGRQVTATNPVRQLDNTPLIARFGHAGNTREIIRQEARFAGRFADRSGDDQRDAHHRYGACRELTGDRGAERGQTPASPEVQGLWQ